MGEFVFRGTTRGWPGNFVPREYGFTPTTTDPIVATLFAAECARFGSAVILACELERLRSLIAPSNVIQKIEREIVIGVSPAEFVERFHPHTIPLERSRRALAEMGFELPVVIGDKESFNNWLNDTPRLDVSQIADYLLRVGITA